MYSIEKNIPLPAPRGISAPKKSKYPFSRMAVGDSFAAPADEASTLRGQACHAGKKHGMKFKTRKNCETVRVWRVE